jgi:FkbM family methyltransferase
LFERISAAPSLRSTPPHVILNTKRLFTKLLSRMEIDVICDVGSMDGGDALTFREAAPTSTIYAFEPNPANLRLMEANPALRERRIQVFPIAATDYDGEAEFFVVDADYSQGDPRRGMSSLYRRCDNQWTATKTVVRVKTTRLESFLINEHSHARVALWIDTEGKAYEVVDGIGTIAASVQLLHIEVETSPLIGSNQKLYPEVKALLEGLGFREAATDAPPSQSQFNALFVRAVLSSGLRFRLGGWILCARLRYLIVRAALGLCPACMERYRAWRHAGRRRARTT